MSRIVVTGGAGRLGRSIVGSLSATGHEVISFDRTISDHLDAEQHVVDLTDLPDAQTAFARVRPDSVIQLAAIAVPFSAPEERILATNNTLAYNVVRSAIDSGATRVVVASSPTVVGYGSPAGWKPQRLPIDEAEATRPWNAYALSKCIAEQIMRMFADQAGDVLFSAFRPCFVISPEEWEGAPTQQGHTVSERLANPELAAPSLFNYVDARDVGSFVNVLLDRLDTIPRAETFFVGAADALALQPLSQLIPRFFPGTEEVASGLHDSTPAFSIAKAEKLLEWSPSYSWRDELTIGHPGGRA